MRALHRRLATRCSPSVRRKPTFAGGEADVQLRSSLARDLSRATEFRSRALRLGARFASSNRPLRSHSPLPAAPRMFYNFCKIHKTQRVTPAMEAGLDDHVWTMEEVVMMADTTNC